MDQGGERETVFIRKGTPIMGVPGDALAFTGDTVESREWRRKWRKRRIYSCPGMEEGAEKEEEHGEKERIEVNLRMLYVTWHDAHVQAFHVHVKRRIHACVPCDVA
jgi:hypothetical protein